MTIDETRRRLPPEFKGENLLTLEVFSTLKNIDRGIGLGKVLKEIFREKKFDSNTLEKAKFEFWPREWKCEPDVVIWIDKMVLFIEAKYESNFGDDQLMREYKAAESLIKERNCEEFWIVCAIDAFHNYDETIENIPKEYEDRIKWISWQEIVEILKKEVDKMDPVSKRCTKDLVELLEDKGLRRFAGFKKDWVDKIIESRTSFENFYEQMCLFIEELTKSLDKKGIKLAYNEGLIDRNGTSKAKNWRNWITTYIEAGYKGEEWKKLRNWRDAYLYVAFRLDKPFMRIGYDVNVCDEKRNMDNGNIKEIYKYLRKYECNNSYIYFRKNSDKVEVNISNTPPKDFNSKIPPKCKSVDIALQIPIKKVTSVEDIEYVKDKILKFKKLVDEYKIYPCILI